MTSKGQLKTSLPLSLYNFIGATSDFVLITPPNNASTFPRTLSSMRINGGQRRLKPLPGSFFVASRPSLRPRAISLVAWSSTSAGPLVKMLSRCGSVWAQSGRGVREYYACPHCRLPPRWMFGETHGAGHGQFVEFRDVTLLASLSEWGSGVAGTRKRSITRGSGQRPA